MNKQFCDTAKKLESELSVLIDECEERCKVALDASLIGEKPRAITEANTYIPKLYALKHARAVFAKEFADLYGAAAGTSSVLATDVAAPPSVSAVSKTEAHNVANPSVPVSNAAVSALSASDKTGASKMYADKRPVSVNVGGRNYAVKTWGDVLIQVCESMIVQAPFQVFGFDGRVELNTGRVNFSYNKSDIKQAPRKLSNNLWVETKRGGDDVMSACGVIIRLCGDGTTEFSVKVAEN